MYEANPKTTNLVGNPILTKAAPEHSYERNDETTPFENFEHLTTKLLKVPKEEMNERRIEWKEARERKQD